MEQNIFSFIWAIADYWWAIVTGLVTPLLFDMPQMFGSEELSAKCDKLLLRARKHMRWGAAAGLLVASFLAYQDERNLRIAAENEVKELHFSVKNSRTRPLVIAERLPVYHIDCKGLLQGYVAIVNMGQSPARIIEWWVGVSVGGEDVPDDLGDMGEITQDSGGATMRPGGRIQTYRYQPNYECKDVEKVMSEKKRIYVFGKYKYADVIGQTYEHTFCHQYSGSETWIYDKEGNVGYQASQGRLCSKHNEELKEPNG